MLKPECWGPSLWKSIHMLALGYPSHPSQLDQIAYKSFFEEFWKVLPCKVPCSVNYRRHLRELSIDNYLENNMKLFEWTVILHNIVNKELGKPMVLLEDAIDMYQCKQDKKELNFGNETNIYIVLMIGTMLVLVAYIIYLHNKIKR